MLPGTRALSFLQNISTGSRAYPASYSVGNEGGGALFPGVRVVDKRLRRKADHSHLLPRLRISVALPLPPLYAFMAYAWTTLTCYMMHER